MSIKKDMNNKEFNNIGNLNLQFNFLIFVVANISNFYLTDFIVSILNNFIFFKF